METDIDETNKGQHFKQSSNARHATVLTELCIRDLVDISTWLPLTKKFEKLEKLVLVKSNVRRSTAWTENLNGFVSLHAHTFPGQLKEITSNSNVDAKLAMHLNMLLETPERLKVHLYGGIGNDLLEKSENSHRMMFEHIKQLTFFEDDSFSWFSESCSESDVSIVSRMLRKCRNLESVIISSPPGSASSSPLITGLIAWAARERHDTAMEATAATATPEASATTPSDQNDSSTSAVVKSRPSVDRIGLKSFTASFISESVLVDVMDAFRDTLEKIDFNHTVFQRIATLGWNWELKSLRVLNLKNCYLQFIKLEIFCPGLEELYLENVHVLNSNINVFNDSMFHFKNTQSIHRNFDYEQELASTCLSWKATPRLRVFSLRDSYQNRTKLDLCSIGDLDGLRSLTLGIAEGLTKNDTNHVFDRLEPVRFPLWNLEHLTRLTILETFEEGSKHWIRLLLFSAPNLEYFSGPEDVLFLEDQVAFWQETRLRTLKRVSHFERGVNRTILGLRKEQDFGTQQENDFERVRIMFENHTTSEGKDAMIWNAHVTKIRSLECRGLWGLYGLRELKKMLKSGDWNRVSTLSLPNDSDSNENDDDNSYDIGGTMRKAFKKERLPTLADVRCTYASTTSFSTPTIATTNDNNNIRKSTNTPQLRQQMCFPRLCHLTFSASIHGCRGSVDLIMTTLLHRGMKTVEVPDTWFVDVPGMIQPVGASSIPRTWRDEDCKEEEEFDFGYCLLIVRHENDTLQFYRLDEEKTQEWLKRREKKKRDDVKQYGHQGPFSFS